MSAPPAYRLTIAPHGWQAQIAADEPVLAGARRAGFRLPSSCRNGSCRACRCRLLAGEVVYRIDWPGLSEDERGEGWILPCVAYPLSDLSIDAKWAIAEPNSAGD